MTSRSRAWRFGLIAWFSLVGALAMVDGNREIRIVAALLFFTVCALYAELAGLRELLHSGDRSGIPENAGPADGIVDRVPIFGVEAIPCLFASDFSRFVRLAEDKHQGHSPTARPGSSGGLLLGKVALVSVFVGRDGVPWSDSEIATGHEAIESVGLWIEQEAIRRGAPLNVSLADVYFEIEDDVSGLVEIGFQLVGNELGPMERHSATKALFLATRLASGLGFSDVVEWMSAINARIDADAKAWLFHLREAGRSFAIPSDFSELPGVGFAVCYGRLASFPEPLDGEATIDPATIAHELLHLFGASDKYGVALQAFPAGTVSSREIMRLTHDSLPMLRIDRLTAMEIGWEPFARSALSRKSPAADPFQARRRAK